MAIKRFFATKDTTITNAFKQNLNTRATASSMGASDVLEVFSIFAQADSGSLEAARALIQFDINDLSASRDNGNIPASGSVDFYLRLYNAKHVQTLPKNYTLEVLPLSASWTEGTGLDMEEYKDTGASNWISSSNDVTWSTEGGDYHNDGALATAVDSLTITNGTPANNDAFTVLVPEAAGGLAGDVTITVIAKTSIGASNPSSTQIQWALDGNDANKIANLKLVFNGTSDTTKVKFGSGVTDGTTVGIKGLTASDGTTSVETFATLTADNPGTGGNDITITDTVGSVLVNEANLSSNKLTGGDDNAGTVFTQSFNGTENLEIDISPLVEKWLVGSPGNHSAAGSGFANYGVGIKLIDTQELTQSGDDEKSYYTKKFFGRGSEYFFKRPNIEARWDSSKSDQRGNFFYSSSLASAADNLNSIYLYNFVRGQLKDIPGAGTTKESIYVQVFSGTLHNDGPSNFALTPTADGVHVNSHTPTVVTGAYISAGIYSASFALTAAATPLTHLFDVWYTGSADNDPLIDIYAGGARNYHTGTIKPYTLEGSNINPTNKYVSSVLDLKSSYDDQENPKLRLFVRDKDWCPSVYTKVTKEIPTQIIEDAFYKVIRVEDNLEVIPYGTGSVNLKYTKMSYDVSGSYFDLDMQLLEPGYMYELKLSYYVNGAYQEQPESFRFRVEKNEY